MADNPLTITEKNAIMRGLHENSTKLVEIQQQVLRGSSYSDSHPNGPYEISFDTDRLNEAIERSNQLQEEALREQTRANEDLMFNARRDSERRAQDMQDQLNKLYDLDSTLRYGFECFIEQTEITQKKLCAIGLGIAKGATSLESILEILLEINIHQAQMLGFLHQIEANESQRNKALTETLENLAANSLRIQASQRYSQAIKHFLTQNYPASIQSIGLALKEDSTHLPSLLLLGQLQSLYLQWRSAKNTFFFTSRLAENEKDWPAYESAIIGLAEIETWVGNYAPALNILNIATKKLQPTKRSLDKIDLQYLRITARRINGQKYRIR
jgi:hypothetical protein